MKSAHRGGEDPDDEVFTQRAVELKDEANALYGAGSIKRALEVYEQALNLLPERDQTRAMIHSNRAACFSKMQCYADVVAEASRALALDGKSYKAYWHRAQAYMQLGQVGKAKKRFAERDRDRTELHGREGCAGRAQRDEQGGGAGGVGRDDPRAREEG